MTASLAVHLAFVPRIMASTTILTIQAPAELPPGIDRLHRNSDHFFHEEDYQYRETVVKLKHQAQTACFRSAIDVSIQEDAARPCQRSHKLEYI